MIHMVTLFKSAPDDDSKDSFIEKLHTENIVCQLIPVIEFKFCNLDDLKVKLTTPEKYSGLILSSPRCVQSLKECLSGEPLNAVWRTKHCFAVGPATEKLARDLFVLNPLGSDAGRGANLAPIIVETISTGQDRSQDLPLLMPASNLALDNIGSALALHGIQVDAPTVYETVPSPQLEERIKEKILPDTHNVFVFFSPSGANAAVPLIDKSIRDSAVSIAIGLTTYESLKTIGITCQGVCSKPNPESVLSMTRLALLEPIAVDKSPVDDPPNDENVPPVGYVPPLRYLGPLVEGETLTEADEDDELLTDNTGGNTETDNA